MDMDTDSPWNHWDHNGSMEQRTHHRKAEPRWETMTHSFLHVTVLSVISILSRSLADRHFSITFRHLLFLSPFVHFYSRAVCCVVSALCRLFFMRSHCADSCALLKCI